MAKNQCSSSSVVPTSAAESADGYILHPVSKFDTLAGLAIKYGVEVSDVKHCNSLASDLQMFAYKTLRIPCIERSAWSFFAAPCNSRSSFKEMPRLNHYPSSTASSAMKLLRGYYGLSSLEQPHTCHGVKSFAQPNYGENDVDDNQPLSPLTRSADQINLLRTNRLLGLSNAFNAVRKYVALSATSSMNNLEKLSEKSVRRRSKTEAPSQEIWDDFHKVHKYNVNHNCADILEKVIPSLLPSTADTSSEGLVIGFLKLLDGALFGGKNREISVSKGVELDGTVNLLEPKNIICSAWGSVKSTNHLSLILDSLKPSIEITAKLGTVKEAQE